MIISRRLFITLLFALLLWALKLPAVQANEENPSSVGGQVFESTGTPSARLLANTPEEPGVWEPSGSFVDKEYIRNGNFAELKTAWSDETDFSTLSGSQTVFVGNNGWNGSNGLNLYPDNPDGVANDCGCTFTVQRLDLPEIINSGTFTLNFGLVEVESGFSFDLFDIYFYEAGSANNRLFTPLTLTDAGAVDNTWKSLSHPLSAGEISALADARTRGNPVWLSLDLKASGVVAVVDNVSLRLSGDDAFPTNLTGDLAFFQYRADLSGKEGIVVHDWHTGNGNFAYQRNTAYSDLAWKPDASEIAFTSNWELIESPYQEDVYAVQPDGTAFRRITNPPSTTEAASGNYPLGTVTGEVENLTGVNLTDLWVYMQGATAAFSCGFVADTGNCTFTLTVADLGAGVPQYFVLTYFYIESLDIYCEFGKDYDISWEVVAGQTVDVGTLTLEDNCLYGGAEELAWKRDGSELAFSWEAGRPSAAINQAAAHVADPGGELFGRELITGTGPIDVAWSPVDDTLLYSYDAIFSDDNDGIWITQPYSGPGTRQISTSNAGYIPPEGAARLAWKPDGSGYIFNFKYHLYEYDLATAKLTPLVQFFNEVPRHPSFSPDGRYVVFEVVRIRTDPEGHNLWMMDMQNPTRLWPISSNHRLGNPDWSKGETPPVPTAVIAGGGGDFRLEWAHNAGFDEYRVWRSQDFYFEPGDPGSGIVETVTPPGTAEDGDPLSFTDPGTLDDAAANYAYRLVGVDTGGATAAPSRPTGGFTFGLTPGE